MGFHTLSIGTSALLTARYGLDVTGQNLGNVDTPGYTRQRLNQAGLQGAGSGLSNAIVGNGVWTQSIRRISDEFAEKQMRTSLNNDYYYGNLKYCYTNIQTYFNELSGNALSDSMSNFWKGMENVDAHVETISIRSTAITEAEQMTRRFNALGTQLTTYRKEADDQVADSVTNINRLLNTVANLNRTIANNELGGATGKVANDLRDQRGEALKELYQYMDIDVVEEANGSMIVSMQGRNLVYFDKVQTVGIDKTGSPDGTLVNTPVFGSDHYPLRPSSGTLAAQMEMRDSIIPSYQKDVNDLAANFIWEFNRAYSQTRGLETFNSVTSLNAPIDPSVTLDKLTYRDNVPAGTFQIVNGNFELIVQNRNTNQPTSVTIEVDLDGRPGPGGEPDTILWDPDNPSAPNSLVNRMQKALDEAAPGAFRVSIDGEYNVSIESLSKDFGFCFGKDSSGVVAALGLNAFFTGHNASSMGVNQVIKENPSLMGSAKSFEKGDNSGIKDMLAVREKALSTLQGMTLEGHYQGTIGRLGSEAANVVSMKKLSEDIYTRMYNQRESISGVNEDEEVSKMITYQRAFQSAAKFISTVDQLYETLINM